MKIKLYIVSYKDMNALLLNLQSLFASDLMRYNYEINIISNHSSFDFNLFFDYFGKINIIRNFLRPDFSTGHLSRNWNEAIVNGFKDLNHPDCDLVMMCQDDSIFKPNFMEKVISSHSKYTFLSAGNGDNFMSFMPNAIKSIGLFDERFCNIFYQEGDYFLRALAHNKEKSSINDRCHFRELNPIIPGGDVNWEFPIVRRTQDGNTEYGLVPTGSAKHMSVSRKIFEAKWPGIMDIRWPQELIDNPPKKPAIPSFIMYPYFEKDVENLEEKGYLTEFSDKWFITI